MSDHQPIRQNIVYTNLTGEDIDRQAEHVIAAMRAARVKRLIRLWASKTKCLASSASGTAAKSELPAAVPACCRLHRGFGSGIYGAASGMASG